MFPVGVMDSPEESQQVVHAVDALRSNIIVVGAKQRGKTTTLMALMCSAATMYTPERVTFFASAGRPWPRLGRFHTLPISCRPRMPRASNAS